ncbi:MAG: hypothetical protein HKN72_02600 [Gemmatimonadetes bacterium]|nr:hypothetical protein [Gemmatimonadota bacterium]
MDSRFRPAMAAAWAGASTRFTGILDADPSLVTARSSCSHPTLLQFVVLDGGLGKMPQAPAFVRALIERGADLEEPLVAAASIGSRPMVELLIEAGAPIEACAPWTPLEESVYWAHEDLSRFLLLEHGARVPSLRAAAGLGALSEIEQFLSGSSPHGGAGPVRFPWGSPSTDPQDVLDQALVIAAKNGRAEAARLLIEHGARPDAQPPGIHEKGGALHLAALFGRGDIVELLIAAGASPDARDPEHQATPAGWARHGGHTELADRLTLLESA